MSEREAIQNLIAELLPEVVPIVALIEAKPETTMNRYGDYMAAISQLAKDKTLAGLVCLAMISAGGNKQGIQDAFRILYRFPA